jgi:hypothetical protein
MSELSQAFGGGDHGRQLVPGSLRGYRTWRRLGRRSGVARGLLPLTAVTRRHVVWSPTLSAECTEPDIALHGMTRAREPEEHRSPAAWCQCGIYAWYAPDDTAVLDAGIFGVFGAIQASGLILMGDRGFRAERAQVVAIVTRNRRLAAACTDAGIKVYRRRRDLLKDYPPEDLSALLGDDTNEPRPSPAPSPPTSPRGFGLALCLAVWARAALVALVAVIMPIAVAIFTAIAAEFALIFLIGSRLRR